jgi:hypothetical protein
VKPEAEALRMEAAPDQHFRLCVLAPDAGHHPAAHFGGNDVSH